MLEPDEYIFTKLANYFKRRKKQQLHLRKHAVNLNDIKPRLTIFARAITGAPINIYEAEREGGYKNTNFFLPKAIAIFPVATKNLKFYLFRTLYLSIQYTLKLNWNDTKAHTLQESQQSALETAPKILQALQKQFPAIEKYHQQFLNYFIENTNTKKKPDTSFLYGKWMRNTIENTQEDTQDTTINKIKNPQKNIPKTLLKSAAVEEIISVQIDQKQLEDAVLQHQFEKVETAEEFGGNFRDMDGEDDLEDHANALEDINMKYTVRVDDTAHSVYQADFIENTTIAESAASDDKGYHITYDEWNVATRKYKENYCKIYPKTLLKTNASYYNTVIKNNKKTLNGLRKMLSTVNNKFQQQRKQSQGDEFDLDALTDVFVAINSRQTPSENCYLSKRKKEKDLSILLLLDSSLSSDGYAAGNRVIDIEKQVAILFGEILNEFAIDFSINTFHSKTRNHSSYITMKGFDESWDTAKFKVGAIDPSGYTRIGAALRHSGALLDTRDTKNKWVILLSDGKPNDYDKYEGNYGIHDVKQALQELNERNIQSYALAIEAQAKYYLPLMFGQNQYQILSSPEALLQSLVKLYEKIKHQS